MLNEAKYNLHVCIYIYIYIYKIYFVTIEKRYFYEGALEERRIT